MNQELPILVVEDDPSLRDAVCDTLLLAERRYSRRPEGRKR